MTARTVLGCESDRLDEDDRTSGRTTSAPDSRSILKSPTDFDNPADSGRGERS
jgi:hypothetical protein